MRDKWDVIISGGVDVESFDLLSYAAIVGLRSFRPILKEDQSGERFHNMVEL